MNFPIREHVTALGVAGFYYLFMGNELGAETCWKTAVDILPLGCFIKAKLTHYKATTTRAGTPAR